jgi:hypothetical protein
MKQFYTIGIVLALWKSALDGYSQGTIKSGLLKVNFSNVSAADSVVLYSSDNVVYGYVISEANSGDIRVVVNNKLLDEKSIIARYTYLDYQILVLDCIEVTSKYYKVSFNNRSVLINRGSRSNAVAYMSWPVFLKTTIITLNEQTPLLSDTISKRPVLNYARYAYKVTHVTGEWCYVECFNGCDDGCPTKPMHGWVRWRKGNQPLLDIRFEC